MILSPYKITAQQFVGNGEVSFVSKAPLETISASSKELVGIVDFKKNKFAFTFPVSSFNGFNSPLQKEHFNDYYLETKKYPKSVFSGKLIGIDSCQTSCEKMAFAKGKLMIHGVENVITVPIALKKDGNRLSIEANFQTALSDYNISIPKILEAKISPIIEVSVLSVLTYSDEP